MYKRKPTSKDRRHHEETTKYHPSVVVIWNKKAYTNTKNLTAWVKNQYSTTSAYPLRDNEPRLLSLDAFAPHKNKGKEVKPNELAKAKKKRLVEEKA